MINRIITWSLHHRFLVISSFIALCAWGVFALQRVPIDAIPDLSENQVIVYADWPGRSPQEVEDQITYPLSVSLQGLAGVKTVRATSMFGFSFLTVIFEDRIDPYFARTRVLERLNSLGDALPGGVTARLGPDATGLGWVYQYYLKDESGTQDLGSLRAVQDTYVRYQLAAVPGVAEVASLGGLRAPVAGRGLRPQAQAIRRHARRGDGRRGRGQPQRRRQDDRGERRRVRRARRRPRAERRRPRVHRPQAAHGKPLLLREVATVRIGGEFRRGALDVNGRAVVGGIVVMRYGENAWQVIQDVKARIAALAPGLPAGVTVESFYDRSDLIARAIDTLKHALTEEILLVTLAHILFLFHFRSILIVTLPLPASILISFILMDRFGIPSHIMSLTGIAISIGVLVDAGIVMTENVIRHCERAEEELGRRLTPPEVFTHTLDRRHAGRPADVLLDAGHHPGLRAGVPADRPGGQALPPARLHQELRAHRRRAARRDRRAGLLHAPRARTLQARERELADEIPPADLRPRARLGAGQPQDRARPRRRPAGAFCLRVAFGLPRAVNARLPDSIARHTQGFGSEFMPTLEEGSLLFMPVLLPATSLTEVQRIMAWQDRVMSEHPAVASVAGKLGRAETATDPAPVEMIETTIMLKPEREWPAGTTKASIIADLSEKLMNVPGYVPGFLQPIENRVLMTSTGIRAQVGVKIFGDNLDALQAKAFEIERVSTASRAPPASRPPACRANPTSKSASAGPTSPAMV
jgi:Cu(I)/Ag(I) efflux system membrane protein CusA/SilA